MSAGTEATSSTQASAPGSSGKLVFANQLRGICVACVVLVHYTVVVQFMRPDVAWVVASPRLDTPPPDILPWFNPPWLDLGKFGVAAFFLISGFVIPFSLLGSGPGSFLLGRALRIFPTFWAGLLAQWGAIAASGAYWHLQPAFRIGDYLPTSLLIATTLSLPSVDWVSWTLSVEVKFYLLAALLRPLLLAHRVWPLLAVNGAALAINVARHAGWITLPPALAAEAMFIGFIQIGTLFYYRYRSAISVPGLAVWVSVILAAFLIDYDLAYGSGVFWSLHTGSFGWAVAAFGAAFAARSRLRPFWPLDALAAISYPLYLVHATIGFAAIEFLIMAWRLSYPAACLVAATTSIALASVLHVCVETPSIRLGHRLRRLTSRRAACGTAGGSSRPGATRRRR